ncbi:hypothetical protein C2E23DRAFT_886399 [Lenzites betulinus]|nr:hypothetical protein C2E23DRAFT_886399 [Lenzites betulinus]
MRTLSMIFALCAIVPSFANPIYNHMLRRDSVAPPITKPTAGTVWMVGETQTITWDVAALQGARPSNPAAQIILGTIAEDGKMRLMFETPLASGFPILSGAVNVTVPSLPSGGNYILCVFGSTRDISPPFMIVGADSDSSASPHQLALLSPGDGKLVHHA